MTARVALLTVCLLTAPIFGNDAFAPATITLSAGERTVEDVLRVIEKRTGNRVVDRRSAEAPKTIDVGFDNLPFWTALDRIVERLDARVDLYRADGIAVNDGPRRGGVISVSGIGRLELRSLIVQRDFITRTNMCIVQAEVAWEPRFEPLYLMVEQVHGSFAADGQGEVVKFDEKSRVAQPVSQRRVQSIEIRLPAPSRTSLAIKSLTAKLKFTGPTRMLDVSFPGLKSGLVTDDGVQVRLVKTTIRRQTWTVALDIENPVGTPEFESFQSWVDNNQIRLERKTPTGTETWTPRPDDQQIDLSGRRAQASYTFTGAQDRGDPSDWTLHYRTPGRIVEITLPFQFRDVPLP